MIRKRILILTLILVFAFTLTSCAVSSNSSTGGDNTLSGGANTLTTGGDAPTDGVNGTPGEDVDSPDDKTDPCPCCPDCIQEECGCDKCADSDDCKCTPGSLIPASITFDLEVKVEITDPTPECSYPECGCVSIASTEVTINLIDFDTGYYGTSHDGAGEYLSFASHYWDSEGRKMLGRATPGTAFGFSAMVAVPGTGNVIKVGLDFSGEGDVTMNWENGETLPYPGLMGRLHGLFKGEFIFGEIVITLDPDEMLDPGTYEFDYDLGMIIFELPIVDLTDSEIHKAFTWDTPGMDFVITITLTPVSYE